MTTQEIKARIEKAQEQVEKKKGTLARHIKKAEKIKAAIVKNGWDPEGGCYQKQGTPEYSDCFMMICDYENAVESIKNTQEAIKDKEQIVANWKAKLAVTAEKEAEADAMPELLKQYKANLTAAFDKADAERRSALYKEYREMGYKEFCRKYSYREYEWIRMDVDQIHKENVRTAEALVNNLWVRVKEICGTVEKIDLYLNNGNQWEGLVINGWVYGKNGTARVESILAGGYNIQRLHIRTLVHKG